MARIKAIFALGVVWAGLPGCAWLSGGDSDLRLESRETGAALEPRFTTQVYTYSDRNTADVLLTDIPLERLQSLTGGDSLPPGNLVRVHLFLSPKAGLTPIDFTANDFTITHVVITEGSYGVYGGGGFLFPSDDPGEGSFSGRIKGANVRLMSSTPGFHDPLLASELSGSINAARDPETAHRLDALLSALARGRSLVAAAPVTAAPGETSGAR